MSTYVLPREPDVDRVWVNYPEGWFVARRIAHDSWEVQGATASEELSWSGLLDRGGVTDQHPDLPDVKFPLMWGRDISGHHILDADEGHVTSVRDEQMARFLVKAANALAEKLNGSEATT